MEARLRADCSRCAGLCCVGPSFSASADFALDKPAGQPCPNLRGDFRCGIHDQLRPRGFPGCTVYDCFGAGQHVVQHTYGGQPWSAQPDRGRELFAVFAVVRDLHELLWYLAEAVDLARGGLRAEVTATRDHVDGLTHRPPADLLALDVDGLRGQANPLLLRASEQARAGTPQRGVNRRGADLAGRDLRGVALHGASLRGALLIGADLRGADLRRADLTGADCRGTDLRGADLTGALFVTPAQLRAALGDPGTRLSSTRERPAHWASTP